MAYSNSLQGAAPLQHTILKGRSHYGITLQTLDSRAFDSGTILAQSSLPGRRISDPCGINYSHLLNLVTPEAADFLIQGLRNKVYLPSFSQESKNNPVHSPEKIGLSLAPKIKPEDRQIGSQPWYFVQIDRQFRALGRLWGYVKLASGDVKRLIFEDFEVVKNEPISTKDSSNDDEGKEHFLELYSDLHGKSSSSIPWSACDDGAVRIGQPQHARPEDTCQYGGDAMYSLRVRNVILEGGSRKPAISVFEKLSRAA